MNIERKRLLKQRGEKTLQNTRGKIPAEEYILTALKASCKWYKASKNSYKRKKDNNGSNNDDNTNIGLAIHDINNLEIVANHRVNATTNDKNAETELANMNNINTAKIENDNNDDNPTMSDKESPLESPAKDNVAKDEEGENSTEEVPSPLIYGRKTNDLTKLSHQKGVDLLRSHPWNSQWVTHKKAKIKKPQIHQIHLYSILLMYEYTHSSLKENQKVKN